MCPASVEAASFPSDCTQYNSHKPHVSLLENEIRVWKKHTFFFFRLLCPLSRKERPQRLPVGPSAVLAHQSICDGLGLEQPGGP